MYKVTPIRLMEEDFLSEAMVASKQYEKTFKLLNEKKKYYSQIRILYSTKLHFQIEDKIHDTLYKQKLRKYVAGRSA